MGGNDMNDWFSLSVAKNEAFCNRIKERKHLKYNIHHTVHTLLISPRRYGKSSLALQTISETKLPNVTMDFTLTSDKNNAQNIINAAVGNLLAKLAPVHKKALDLATKFFSRMQPRLVLDTQFGMRIELHPEFSSPQMAINEILLNADKFAIAANKRAVILMDEFQQIATLNDAVTIEAAIRNAAQIMQNISLIFSGSNRHLMQMIFDDSHRPFYHLCDRINLDRIAADDYRAHLQKAAEDCWQRSLPNECIEQILLLSQRHSYYLNVICSRLWRNEKMFVLDDINHVWQQYLAEEQDRIGADIAKLGNYQRQLLLLLAIQPFKQPTSKEVVHKLGASVGSVAKAFNILMRNDYVYLDTVSGNYKILDPLLESYLQNQARFLFAQ